MTKEQMQEFCDAVNNDSTVTVSEEYLREVARIREQKRKLREMEQLWKTAE